MYEFVAPVRRARRFSPALFAARALAGVAVCGFAGWVALRMVGAEPAALFALDAPPAPAASAADHAAQHATEPTAPAALAPRYAALFDPNPAMGFTPEPADSAPVAPSAAEKSAARTAPTSDDASSARPMILDAPAPPVRPADARAPEPRATALRAANDARAFAAARRRARLQPPQTAAAQPAEPSFLEKVFGLDRASGPQLAYAPQEDSILSSRPAALTPSAFGYDRQTAIYDISARTVYLPNGAKLEAHSGLGDHMDDPRRVHVRMKGATPPHVYNLQWRESLFHGVRAIRLLPQGGAGAIHGRAGLLAHTYMLGPRGDSNGCVSFRDYAAFMRAFESGQIRKLAVVASLR